MNYYVRDLLRWRISNGMRVRVWAADNDSDGDEDNDHSTKMMAAETNAHTILSGDKSKRKRMPTKTWHTQKSMSATYQTDSVGYANRKPTRNIEMVVYTKSYPDPPVVDVMEIGHFYLLGLGGACVRVRARACVHLCHLLCDHLLLWGRSATESISRDITTELFVLYFGLVIVNLWTPNRSCSPLLSQPVVPAGVSVCADLILTYLYAIRLKANM